MNEPPGWEATRAFHDFPSSSTSLLTKLISTIALLLLGYYVLSLLDLWPETVKRHLYEVGLYLIPSPAIYGLQAIMHRYSGAFDESTRFRRADFGNPQAKAEAIRRILGHSPFPTALRKARSMSGIENIMPASKESGPPGLGNWDNSCYQNSILQGLASLPVFQRYIEKSLTLCDNLEVPAATHRALRLFLHQLGDASARKTTLWTPSVLKSMDSWQQQDAQEYFSRVVDSVEKEDAKCIQVLKRRCRAGLPAFDVSGAEESADMLEKVAIVDDKQEEGPSPRSHVLSKEERELLDAVPRSPVDGMLAQALECQTCGFSEGYSLTQFNCLTLNMGLRGHSYLEDLLDEYTDPEMIEGVECTECTKALADGEGDHEDCPSPSKRPKLKPVHRTKAKQITIGRLPRALVLHINRSIFDDYGNQRKNAALVRFPARLEFLSRWCAPLSADEDAVQRVYELKCSVTHFGRHENGHYVALGKRDKDWYCFNDEVVTKLDQEEVLSRGNVFMLFYEAVDSPSPLTKQSPVPQPVVDNVQSAVQPAEAHHLTDSTASSSESEPLVEAGPQEPVTPVPVMRTASGSVRTAEERDLPSTPVVAL